MQQEKNCVFNSAATISQGYHESFLAVSPSSPLHISNQKGRKTCPEKARCACASRLSHPYVFPARFPPSINTHTHTHTYIYKREKERERERETWILNKKTLTRNMQENYDYFITRFCSFLISVTEIVFDFVI